MIAPHLPRLACLAYLFILALATLGGAQWNWQLSQLLQAWETGFIPVQFGGRDWLDALRNVLLFAGWGVVFTLSRHRICRKTVWAATFWGALLSLTIELLQLFSSVRVSSVLDLMTNTLGAWLGALSVFLIVHWRERSTWRCHGLGLPLWMLTGPLWVAGFCQIMFPLMRRSPLEGVYGSPMQRFDAVWSHAGQDFDGTVLLTLESVWAPVLGLTLVLSLLEMRVPQSVRFAALTLTALIFGPLAENLRALAGMLPHQATGLVHGGLVLLAGGLAQYTPVWHRIRQHWQALVHLLLVLVLCALCLSAWQPFVWLDWSQNAWASGRYFLIPLAAQLQRVELLSAVEILTLFSLYCSVALLLAARWPTRRDLMLAGLFALMLECGQIFVQGRYFDTTDILIPWAGLLCGWRLASIRYRLPRPA